MDIMSESGATEGLAPSKAEPGEHLRGEQETKDAYAYLEQAAARAGKKSGIETFIYGLVASTLKHAGVDKAAGAMAFAVKVMEELGVSDDDLKAAIATVRDQPNPED